jgi:hypothetical protein
MRLEDNANYTPVGVVTFPPARKGWLRRAFWDYSNDRLYILGTDSIEDTATAILRSIVGML